MSDKTMKADALHNKGYNCAQAVACTFAEELGKGEKEVFEIMEAFGLGMGSMGTCGAVTGMAAVVGMKNSDGNLDKPGTKKSSYTQMKELNQKFIDKNGSNICRELKGIDTGEMLRSCPGCIEDCVAILEEYLK